MTDEGVFSFEEEDVVVRPMLTSPLPGSSNLRVFTSPSSVHPSPGMLFGSSPRPVASGVTRGGKKEETRVRLVHIRDPREICGGVIGVIENKKFCAAQPNQCEHRLTHSKRKFDLQPNTLYVMSSKKGASHDTLLPKLNANCIPADKELVDLLSDERPVAMWHVYFDGCNTLEEATGENELEAPHDTSWEEAVERPSLEDLERANDFKTPRKVRLMSGFVEAIHTFEMVALGRIQPLDLSGLQSIGGIPTPSQRAVRQMFEGWDTIKDNFELMWSTMMSQEEKTKNDQISIKAQLQEAIDYLNDIGAKARLLSAKIGRNPKAEADGDTTLWEALSELANESHLVKLSIQDPPKTMNSANEKLSKHEVDIRKMDQNMNRMYTHYKGYLGSNNARLADVERQVAAARDGPRPQAQEDVFDFGHVQDSQNVLPVQAELRKLREEVAMVKRELNETRAPDRQTSTTDNIFPIASREEIISRLKVVETRGTSTGKTCELGGTTFSSEVDVRGYITEHDISSCALY
jgi:hypothetical protein